MKTAFFKTFTMGSLLLLTSLTYAANSDYPGYLEKDLIRICNAAQQNNVYKFKRAVRESRLSYKAIEKGLVCNGKSLLDFAVENQSERTALFIARRANINEQEVVAKFNKSNQKMGLGE